MTLAYVINNAQRRVGPGSQENAQRNVEEHQTVWLCQSLLVLSGFPNRSHILCTVWGKRPLDGSNQSTLLEVPIYLALERTN